MCARACVCVCMLCREILTGPVISFVLKKQSHSLISATTVKIEFS